MGVFRDDLLKEAGYSEGDQIPIVSYNAGDQTANVSTDTYTSIFTSDLQIIMFPDRHFPGGTVQVHVQFELSEPNGDQIDVRLRDAGQSQTVVEKTGITSNTRITLGYTPYTPSNPSSRSLFRLQARNADGTTTITLRDPVCIFGVSV